MPSGCVEGLRAGLGFLDTENCLIGIGPAEPPNAIAVVACPDARAV